MKKTLYLCIGLIFTFMACEKTDDNNTPSDVTGCMDSLAFNYNILATTDNDSCCYVGGCTDPIAVNYDTSACYDDGSCILPVLGCTDSTAINYDPLANIDDGSCISIVGVWTPILQEIDMSYTVEMLGQIVAQGDSSFTITPNDPSWDMEGDVEFTVEGEMLVDGETNTYSFSGSILTVTDEYGEVTENQCTVSATTLTIIFTGQDVEDDNGTITTTNYTGTITATRN